MTFIRKVSKILTHVTLNLNEKIKGQARKSSYGRYTFFVVLSCYILYPKRFFIQYGEVVIHLPHLRMHIYDTPATSKIPLIPKFANLFKATVLLIICEIKLINRSIVRNWKFWKLLQARFTI